MIKSILVGFLAAAFSLPLAHAGTPVATPFGGPTAAKCAHGPAAKADVPTRTFAHLPPAGTKAICPVTGEEFVVDKSTQSSEYQGRYYVFCCDGCKPKFDQTPSKFAKPL